MTWYTSRPFRAAVVFVVVTTLIASVAGFSEEAPPEDSPELFGTAASWPGDDLLYKTALVVVDGERAEWVDVEAQYAMQRLDDRIMLDRVGRPQSVSSFVAEWEAAPFPFRLEDYIRFDMPDCQPDWPTGTSEDDWEEYGEAWEDCADDIEDWADDMADRWQDWGVSMAAYMGDTHTLAGRSWRVTHHGNGTDIATTLRGDDPGITCQFSFGGSECSGLLSSSSLTRPDATPGPCGWKHSLQGTQQDLWAPVTLHGDCPALMHLGFGMTEPLAGPIEVRVSGTDTVDGREATVFSWADDPDRLRVWFASDVPYPIRTLSRLDVVPAALEPYVSDEPDVYVLHELLEFTPGAPATSPRPPPLDGPTQRLITGPDESGMEHPWPLAEAFVAARDDLVYSGVRDFLDGRPDSAVVDARWSYIEEDDPDHHEPIIDETWTFILSDGASAIEVIAERHTETMLDNRTITQVPVTVREPQLSFDDEDVDDDWPGAQDIPTTLLGVTAQAQRLAIFSATAPDGWTFSMPCGRCDAADVRLRLGHIGTGLVDELTLDGHGGFIQHALSPTTYPDPRFSDPAWEARASGTPWGWGVASKGVWTWPEPITAATGAGLGLAGAILYLIWPAIKSLGALPLFSRIDRTQLLEHPVRQDIHDLVTARPGIHFQQIVRSLEKGRGTTEHHLRKLVQADLLIEKPHQGFTCYFPRGKLDRHLMAAAPALKARGAQQIMQAIVAQPGAVAQELANRLGISPSTVNYHLKKLQGAGLVDGSRSGRAIRLTATPIGQQALGAFVAT